MISDEASDQDAADYRQQQFRGLHEAETVQGVRKQCQEKTLKSYGGAMYATIQPPETWILSELS